jgi:tetrahydromethanopterin S-methyltransferase subunit F
VHKPFFASISASNFLARDKKLVSGVASLFTGILDIFLLGEIV